VRNEEEHLTAATTDRPGDDEERAAVPGGDTTVDPREDDSGGGPAVVDDPEHDPEHVPDHDRGSGEHDAAPAAWTELSGADEPPQGMIPARARRRTSFERGSMRVLATGGIIGLATLLGAILVSQDVAGWIVGLVVGLTSVVLAALLWSSRQL
jgi:hypothetical protein